jgi:hypothetical protein
MTEAAQRRAAIVAQYRAGATLARLGTAHGVSTERIRQIIMRHEQLTGERVPRGKVTWSCGGCGREELRTRFKAKAKLCDDYLRRAPRPSIRTITQADVDAAIELRQSGHTWRQIEERLRHSYQALQQRIWQRPARRGSAVEAHGGANPAELGREGTPILAAELARHNHWDHTDALSERLAIMCNRWARSIETHSSRSSTMRLIKKRTAARSGFLQ